jgi:3-phenylpropionate/trans-cinnamate dioxygenase ferredoxin subunit
MTGRPAARLGDLPPGHLLRVVLRGVPVALVRLADGTVHAVGDTCTHANISLAEGEISDRALECPLHGSRFDLASGRPLTLPATRPVCVFPATVDGDDILVDVTTTLGEAPSPIASAGKEY